MYATTYKREGVREGRLRLAEQGDSRTAQQIYPMAWDLANHGVAGIDRTAVYEAACNKC